MQTPYQGQGRRPELGCVNITEPVKSHVVLEDASSTDIGLHYQGIKKPAE